MSRFSQVKVKTDKKNLDILMTISELYNTSVGQSRELLIDRDNLNDIKDFSGTNKVIVLIVLGAILLASSYGYVKLKKTFDDRNKELP